jgi:hypothetical protein
VDFLYSKISTRHGRTTPDPNPTIFFILSLSKLQTFIARVGTTFLGRHTISSSIIHGENNEIDKICITIFKPYGLTGTVFV